jgi:hypothetical protein
MKLARFVKEGLCEEVLHSESKYQEAKYERENAAIQIN